MRYTINLIICVLINTKLIQYNTKLTVLLYHVPIVSKILIPELLTLRQIINLATLLLYYTTGLQDRVRDKEHARFNCEVHLVRASKM